MAEQESLLDLMERVRADFERVGAVIIESFGRFNRSYRALEARLADTDGGTVVPIAARPPPTDDTDREELYAFLDEVGYRRAGDLVYLKPLLVSRTAEVNKPEHAAVAVMGTANLDRVGFKQMFNPDGCRLERFRKNPIVLYNHDYEGLPVARSLWERVREGDDGPEMLAKPQFHMDTELSREVYGLLVAGHLSAWELGVIPETWEKRGEGYHVTSWSVLEYSVVPRAEDMAGLREAYIKNRVSSPAIVKSIPKEANRG